MYYIILRVDYKTRLAEIVSSWFHELSAIEAFTGEIDKFIKSGHAASLSNKQTAIITKYTHGYIYGVNEIRYIVQLLSFDDCHDDEEPQ